MSGEEAIAMDRIVVRYRGKAALDGFTLSVPKGAVYALLGDNGAGKSTSMKVLTGHNNEAKNPGEYAQRRFAADSNEWRYFL